MKMRRRQTKCFVCGEENPSVLEQHHIIPRRYNGTDDEKNIVTLCANCHRAVEKMYGEEFFSAVMEHIGDVVDAPIVSVGQTSLVSPDIDQNERRLDTGPSHEEIERDVRDKIISRLVNDVGLSPTEIAGAFDVKRARISQIAHTTEVRE